MVNPRTIHRFGMAHTTQFSDWWYFRLGFACINIQFFSIDNSLSFFRFGILRPHSATWMPVWEPIGGLSWIPTGAMQLRLLLYLPRTSSIDFRSSHESEVVCFKGISRLNPHKKTIGWTILLTIRRMNHNVVQYLPLTINQINAINPQFGS